jgi:hypothetical protein
VSFVACELADVPNDAFARRFEHALDVTVRCSHDADPRKHRRPARRCDQDQGFRRLLSHRRLVELGLKGEEMTKTPGEFEPPKPISKAERDARKTFRKLDAEKAMTEHEIEQKAFSANRERLKAERLTREAAAPPVAAKKAKTKRKAR